MNKSLFANTLITDGKKAVPLNALPEEAWTFITGTGPDTKELQDLYDAVPWLYRGVGLRAQRLVGVPFVFMRGDEEIDRSDSYENVLGWLPDPFTLFEQVEADLTLHSRAYLLKERNIMQRFIGQGLRRLYPNTIRPRVDAERGITGFIRTINNKQLPPLDLDEIVHFMLPDPWSEIGRARSPAEAALSAAGVLKSVDEFSTAFFDRGAVKVTLLTVSGSTAEQERDRMESWWQRVIGGIKNAWSGKVFNADRVTPVPIGEGISELSNQELTKEKREDISTALGIPQSLLFSTGTVNRAVSQQDDINFYTDTIIPEARRIERTLNAQVFQAEGIRLQFRPQELSVFQEDEEARSMALLNLVQAGETLDNAYQILGFDVPDELVQARLQEMEPEPAPQLLLPPSNGSSPFLSVLEQWERKSLKRLKSGRDAYCEFESDLIPLTLNESIAGQLEGASDEQEVRMVFSQAKLWDEGAYTSKDGDMNAAELMMVIGMMERMTKNSGGGSDSFDKLLAFLIARESGEKPPLAGLTIHTDKMDYTPEIKMEPLQVTVEYPEERPMTVQMPEEFLASFKSMVKQLPEDQRPVVNVNVPVPEVNVTNEVPLPKVIRERSKVNRGRDKLIESIDSETRLEE